MSFNSSVKSARSDIKSARDECLGLIEQAEKTLSNAPKGRHEIIRLMIVPILYSTWERLFTVANVNRIRILQSRHSQSKRYPAMQRVAWLFKESFFQSFKDKCAQPDINYKVLLDFLVKMDHWHDHPLKSSLQPEKLIITKSNVNAEVVRLNAELFGLDSEPKYKLLDVSKLDELVGRRNDIGHGGTIKPPGPKELEELLLYTKKLISEYASLMSTSLIKLRKSR